MRNQARRASLRGERSGHAVTITMLVSGAALLMLLPAATSAQTPVARQTEDFAIAKAAAVLSSSQHDFEGSPASWSWRRGHTRAAPNTGGIVALALIEAHEARGDAAALVAAGAWADARLGDVEGWRSIFDPDVEALARLSAVTGNPRYQAVAEEAFARRWEGATGEEIVERLLMVRRRIPSIVGYDAALVMRAAIAIGKVDVARDVFGAAMSRRDSWDPASRGGDVDGLATTSIAALLSAAAMIEDLDRAGAKAREDLMLRLVASQDPGGSWAFRNTQTTAYAIVALSRMSSPLAEDAVRRGTRWLKSTQLPDGHWAGFNDGLPEPFVGDVVNEVTAEVLLALLAARR